MLMADRTLLIGYNQRHPVIIARKIKPHDWTKAIMTIDIDEPLHYDYNLGNDDENSAVREWIRTFMAGAGVLVGVLKRWADGHDGVAILTRSCIWQCA
jgi:hypothetical protein